MEIKEFLLKYGSSLNDLEEKFLLNIFYKDYGTKGLNYLVPQYEITKPDGSGVWRYDFVIITKYNKYIIETDGLYSHAEGKVTKEYYNNLQDKQNEAINQGFKIIRFTNDKVRNKPQECIWDLRREFMGDEELYNIYLNRTGKIAPHEVQELALENLEDTRDAGKDKGLVVLATGLGKTYLSAFDVKNFKAKKILFIVHMNEILKQSLNSFQDVLPERLNEMGLYNGNEKNGDKEIIFASIQTLSRKHHLEKFAPREFDYIIMDESHHSAAPTYKKIFNHFKPKFFLGLTATPERNDKKEILPFYGNNIVFEMNQMEAIKRGFLVPYNYYGIKDNIDYSNIKFNGFKYDVNDLNKLLMIEKRDEEIITKFKEYAIDKENNIKKTIGFCVSIEHANWCTRKFKEAGFNAIAIHSKLDSTDLEINEKDRDVLITKFKKNKFDIAFVVNMFNEGIDIPDVECLLFLRPTESKSIFIQHMGRGLRISPKKEFILVLDFIGNYRTAGTSLGGLGFTNTSQLKKKKIGDKLIYYYDNNGCTVEFEEDVVEIFKQLSATLTKKVNMDLIPEKWIEFGEYLESNTQEGVKLHWKIGNKNKHLNVHLWALNFLSDKLDKLEQTELDKLLRKESRKEFPGKTMEGLRALFMSKLLGFIKKEKKLELTEVFNEINSTTNNDYKNTLITNQFEKFYFWNNLFSVVNRHVSKDQRVPINDYFKIYPFFFIYEILIELKNSYGYETSYLTKFEINTFLVLAQKHSDIKEVMERIISIREHEEKYEIQKYLKQKNKIDARFYPILIYNKYFIWENDKITLKEEYFEEVENKVKEFKYLLHENKLIKFNDENSDEYFNLLYSKKDLLNYHKN